MNYYLDTEFIEGSQTRRFCGIEIGKTKPTIDLISIGIVSDDGREYYSISKDFNLREAWDRFDLVHQSGDARNIWPEGKKVYWLRENVLKPIWKELFEKYSLDINIYSNKQAERFSKELKAGDFDHWFTFKSLKSLIGKYGKTNKEIAQEVFEFCTQDEITIEKSKFYDVHHPPMNFYGYFADYDWVVFAWLFGLMKDLPNGFPYYCRDLKQMFDDNAGLLPALNRDKATEMVHEDSTLDERIIDLKNHPDYPKQENEHNALSDARWNKKLHEFIKSTNGFLWW